MKSKVSRKQKIGVVVIVALLAVSLILFYAFPTLAHIPEGWCPIEECWKHVEGGDGDAAAADVSVACMYKAMNAAVGELWDGKPPRRSDIKIISKLPTLGAKHAAQCITGIPEGEAPPEWISDNPGEIQCLPVEGTGVKNLRLENFEITIIRKSTGEKYTWRPGSNVFPANYCKCRNREARGEKAKWWKEAECAGVTGRALTKLEESIGLILSSELHDNYAYPLDREIVGKVNEEDTILYLAAALAESGDKGELKAFRNRVNQASELIDGMHDLVHYELVPLAEEMGKGKEEANTLRDLAYKLMASIDKIGMYLDEIEKTDGVDKVKEKATEMLEEAKKLKGFASEALVHSTDPATVFTEQEPLRLEDGGEVIELKYEWLQRYHSEMSSEGEEKEGTPIGGAVAFGVIVVGLVILGVMRGMKRRRR